MTTPVAAYFLQDEKVRPAQRTAHGVGTAADAVRALIAGPRASERAAGWSTAVPAETKLRSLALTNALMTVDLSGSFASGGGSFSMRARMAQLVATLTQFPTVTRVRLWLDGRPATTLGGEGYLVDKAFTRTDIDDWLPAILIDSPAAGAHVTSPVTVSGSADVFEAVLFVQVTDWDGRVVATKRVMASAGTGTRGAFSVTIPYHVDREGSGEIIGYAISPKDGSRIDVIETQVTVAP